jgi:DNA-binding MarR family transcriptional regulator/GNAT superfamily N-acetyltransferase
MKSSASIDRRVAEVRSFNRFYTREIGTLRESFLDSGLTLPEARVVYELARCKQMTATEIGRQLRMDAGYLSRLLQKLHRRKLITRERSTSDGRQSLLQLTKRGQQQFELQNDRQNEEVQKMLAKLSGEDQQRMVTAMKTIQRVLGGEEPTKDAKAFVLRPPRLGDVGWIVYRHGEGYATLYGWNESFEALVARVVSDFETAHDPKRERCWIAEHDGERMGCVFLLRHPDQKDAAKLRLLWVEPSARGLGLGKALVQECTRFAKQAGYKKIVLFTNSELKAARGIYEGEGYKLVKQEPHPMFPKGQMAEEWELEL